MNELSKLIPITGKDYKEMSRAYQGARIFPHGAIDDFLDPEFAEQLLKEFPKFEVKRAMGDSGRPGGKATNENIRSIGPAFRKLDDLMSSKEFLAWLSDYVGIPDLMFDPMYAGGGTHESVEGEELATHLDFNTHPQYGWHRRCNMIIYLNKNWGKDWGGQLDLLKDPWGPLENDEIIGVHPLFNRAGMFTTSEHSWHGFPPIKLPPEQKGNSRKSIAFFFYTKERKDAVAPRSTVYVERRLPASIKPGIVLTKEDHDEIRSLLTRRDGVMQLLYKRELSMSADYQNLKWMYNDFQRIVQDRMTHIEKHLARDFEKRNDLPVIVDRATDGRLFVSSMTVGHPVYMPGYEVLQERPTSYHAGDQVVVSTDLADLGRPDYLMVCQVVEHLNDNFYLVAQKSTPRVAVVSRKLILGKVKTVLDWNRKEVQLYPSLLGTYTAGSLSFAAQCALSKLFFSLNHLKNKLIGGVRSPLLWKLSQAYRGVLSRFGVQVPAILPDKRNQ